MTDSSPPAFSTGTRILRRENAEAWVHRAMHVEVCGDPEKRAGFVGGVLRIGSDGDNELVLHDDGVSARHCEIALRPEGALLRDLGSTNGTRVDGVEVLSAYLAAASIIQIGSTRVSFVVGDGDVATTLSARTNFGGLLGHGPKMRAVFAMLEQVAKTDTTLLIGGESGTGKELAARAVHDASARADGPFVVFDCGAVAPALVESFLFGHARGAFTGATDGREGVFEQAQGGTLVLDEIGELPLELQPKLLRAIESRTVTRLGENKTRAVDVRFLASTNRVLTSEVAAGRFRSDLFYRLSVIAVTLPPLRERREEIPRLVAHLLARVSGDAAPEIDRATMSLLTAYDWPGNVRELRNVLERLVTLRGVPAATLIHGDTGTTPQGTGPEGIDPFTQSFHEAKQTELERFEHAYLSRRLADAGGNVSEAARLCGLSRQSLHRLINKYGI